MKYLLIPTILLLLTSCFKVDEDGDIFLFEENHSDGAVIRFEFSNITTSTYYFGTNGQYSVNQFDVSSFDNDRYWCLGRFEYHSNTGSAPTLEAIINETPMGSPISSGNEMMINIYPGQSLKFALNCPTCTSDAGEFTVELRSCD